MVGSEHIHLTRDIKAPGECPGCDVHHAKMAEAEVMDRKATEEIQAQTAERSSRRKRR